LISGSRTSTLSCVITSLAMTQIAGKKHLRVWFLFVSSVICTLFLSFHSAGGTSEILAGIVLKQNTQAASSDLTNGRNVIWSDVLKDSRVLGHGSHYFGDYVGIGPHNSFVGILGERGPLAASLLIVVAVLSTVSAWRFAKKNFLFDPFSVGVFAIVLHFWTVSLTEGLFGSFGTELTIASFLSFGVVTQRRVCFGVFKFVISPGANRVIAGTE
jgi:hypothetical protein